MHTCVGGVDACGVGVGACGSRANENDMWSEGERVKGTCVSRVSERTRGTCGPRARQGPRAREESMRSKGE